MDFIANTVFIKSNGDFLFTRIMRQSPCLHEALPNIAITGETRKACFISLLQLIN